MGVSADDRAGDVKHSQADISRAREVIGYDPQVTFAEGLRRTVEWFQGTEATTCCVPEPPKSGLQ